MAINMMCMNSDCKYYWEDNCMRNMNEERIVINGNGQCETFEEGVNELYTDETNLRRNIKMTKPKRIEYGTHKGKVQCTQYACLNNYGMQTGIIHDAGYPSGCCMLESPNVTDFENGTWGCSNERYGNEIEKP